MSRYMPKTKDEAKADLLSAAAQLRAVGDAKGADKIEALAKMYDKVSE